MELETNEKVLAMYRAVWSLIDEGCDIYRLKVSDITERAGIGKGTAYEYFRSKEELLERAVRYDSLLQYRRLCEGLENQQTLKGCVNSVFDWMEENLRRRRIAIQFMKMGREHRKIQDEEDMPCMGKDKGHMLEEFRHLLKDMVDKGRRENCISPDIPDQYACLELLGLFMEFYFYLFFEKAEDCEEIRKTKDFLYGNIIKSLL